VYQKYELVVNKSIQKCISKSFLKTSTKKKNLARTGSNLMKMSTSLNLKIQIPFYLFSLNEFDIYKMYFE
jgi:hypothetical protein